MHSLPCNIQEHKCPSTSFHVTSRQIYCSFHFLSIGLPQRLLSSFGAKYLSFTEMKVSCVIPRKRSAHHWDFLKITVTVFWLIWQWAQSANNIRIWRAGLSMGLFLIASATLSNFLYYIILSSGRAATSFFIYSWHTFLESFKPKSLRCGKCEGTSSNQPLPTNTR
jgi:hypothetical protein